MKTLINVKGLNRSLILVFITTCLFSSFFTSCKDDNNEQVEDVISSYLASLKKNDFRGIQANVSADQDSMYLKFVLRYIDPIYYKLTLVPSNSTSIEINHIKVDGKKAHVSGTVVSPYTQYSNMYEEIAQMFSRIGQRNMDPSNKMYVHRKEYTVDSFHYSLVNELGVWKISFDIEGHKKVDSILNEAFQYSRANKLNEAINSYENAFKLDSNLSFIVYEISILKSRLKSDKEMQRPNWEFVNLPYESWFYEQIKPMIISSESELNRFINTIKSERIVDEKLVEAYSSLKINFLDENLILYPITRGSGSISNYLRLYYVQDHIFFDVYNNSEFLSEFTLDMASYCFVYKVPKFKYAEIFFLDEGKIVSSLAL